MSAEVNPYQAPVLDAEEPLDLDIIVHGEYQIHPFDVRSAERWYVIYHHQLLLIISCTLMVGLSGWIMFNVAQSNPKVSQMLVATLGSMGISASIYLALVHRTKHKTRKLIGEHGLDQPQKCNLCSTPETLTITVGESTSTWSNHSVKSHSYSDGLLFCSEPYLYYAVPKSIDLNNISFKHFAKIIQQRNGSQRNQDSQQGQ